MTAELHRSESKLWSTIAEVVSEEGLQLFDIDEPQGGSVLRVFVIANNAGEVPSTVPSNDDVNGTSANGPANGERRVGFDDCVRVSRRLLDIDEAEAFIPEGCLLEVSSPGVNRRLRLPQHFAGAVGERVKIKFRTSEGTSRTVVGVLRSFDENVISIAVEGHDEIASCALMEVRDARVDFLFDEHKKKK